MGLGAVLRGEQSFGSWLTGREYNENELAVPDTGKAESTIEELVNIANSTPDVGGAINGALATLNGTHGMDLIGGFQLSGLDAAFDQIEAQIKGVASVMDKRLGDAKYYSSSLPEKIFGTIGMGVAKIGEGFLSAFEDIGDGVVSVVGWIAPKDSDVEKWCQNFVEKDLAHDAFQWYYESNLAKASAFTEDSAIAGACEIGGKAAGYLFAGGALNGLAGTTGKALTIGGKMIASSSTLAATAVAGLGGLGAGTETGLYQGKSFDEAFTTNGVRQAGINVALAFAGGKLGERAAIRGAAKAKAGTGATRAAVKAQREAIKQGIKSKTINAGQFQGYSDMFTHAGEHVGAATRHVIAHPIQSAGAGIHAVGNGAKAVGNAFKHPIQTLGNGAKAVGNGLKTAGQATKTAVTEAAKHPLQTTGKLLKGTVVTTTKVVTNPATVIAAYDQIGSHGKAEDQFRELGMATPDGQPLPTKAPTVTGQPGTPKVTDPKITEKPFTEEPPTTTPTETSTRKTSGPGGPGGTDPAQPPTLPPTTQPTVPTVPTPTTPTPTTPTSAPPAATEAPPYSETELPPQHGPIGEHDGAGYAGEDLEEALDSDAVMTSIDDIIKGNKYSKIPTSSAPIGRRTTTTGSTVIPISAGLSAAAAVGLGAKAYLDKKTNDEEDEDEAIEKWQGEGSIDIAPEKVEEEDTLLQEDGEKSLQSRILESVTGESYSDL